MRLSGLQENGCGIGLSENQLPSDETMAAITDIEPRNEASEEDSLVSNLPLLFADGYPTSLEKITLTQLERFVTFMVQCSLGHDTAETITEPCWWPKEVKFSSPLTRPKRVNDNWMANLKKLVFRCYTYHRSEYLLRFCSFLARYPHEELEYVNNWDSTTSLYHKSTGKLLVTFRNENMNYDKKDSPRKTLLSHNGASSKSKPQQQSRVMVEPPCGDIYLCDNCDAEFIGLEKMKEHEQVCYAQEHSSNGSRPSTPDLLVVEPEFKQDQFLEYFKLCSKNAESKTTETSNSTTTCSIVQRLTSRRVRGAISLARCPTIPFSSPAGMMLAKKSKTMTEETQHERLERIERHAIAPVLTASSRPKWLDKEVERDKWTVTYKLNRDKPADEYVHQYKFGTFYKSKPILNIQSQLLYILCRPVYVVLKRLTQKQIEELKRDPSKYRSPVRKIMVKKRPGPGTRTKSKLTISLKRKGEEKPGNKKNPIVIDDEENSAATAAVTTSMFLNTVISTPPTISNSNTAVSTTSSSTASITMERTVEALTTCKSIKPSTDKTPIAKSIKENAISSKSPNSVTIVNLCSSDEEDSNVSTPSDENKDPMDSTDAANRKVLLRRFTPSRLCSNPCIYSGDSTSDWLSENLLNDDSENCANRYRNSVMLNPCTQLSPILRSTP